MSSVDVMSEVTGLDQIPTNRTRFRNLPFLSLDPSAVVNLVLKLNVSIEVLGGGKLLGALRTNDSLIMCQDVFIKCLEV